MSGAGAASPKLSICVLLLSFGCPRLQAECTSNMCRQGTLLLDLNRTVFINTIVLNITVGNHDYIDVDIGTESCDLFDDKACYITCSSREPVQSTADYVTINVTCDVDNARGRYVRVRQDNSTGLPVTCDVKVIGWSDLGKAFKNFALNAPCNQSSTYFNGTSNKAVDGNRDGHYHDYSCTHTHISLDPQLSHWWQVDLGKLILVSHIIIANRVDCCSERLANFTVELGRVESKGNITYSLCRYFDGIAGALTTLNCTRSIWGQFVRISMMGEALTLCEVEVYGDTDDNITRVVSVIPTSFICDDVPGTSLATLNMTTGTIKSTMSSRGTTKAKVSQTFIDITSKAQESTVNLNAKVSTMYSGITTKAKVSTEYPELTTAAKVSTMNQEITTKAKVSTVAAELTTKAKVSTVFPGLPTEAKVSTVFPGLPTAAKVSTVLPGLPTAAKVSTLFPGLPTAAKVSTLFPGLPTAAKVSTMNPENTTKAKVSTVFPGLPTEAKVSTKNPENTTKAKVSTVAAEVITKVQVSTLHPELTTKAKVSTTHPIVVTEAKLYSEQPHDPQIITAPPQTTTATPHGYNYCTCKLKIMTKSQEEVHQKIKQTAKALKMNHSALGKQVRKKSSAPDQRVSASAVGIACTIAFSSIFIVIVLCDIYGLCQYLLKKKKEKLREQ